MGDLVTHPGLYGSEGERTLGADLGVGGVRGYPAPSSGSLCSEGTRHPPNGRGVPPPPPGGWPGFFFWMTSAFSRRSIRRFSFPTGAPHEAGGGGGRCPSGGIVQLVPVHFPSPLPAPMDPPFAPGPLGLHFPLTPLSGALSPPPNPPRHPPPTTAVRSLDTLLGGAGGRQCRRHTSGTAESRGGARARPPPRRRCGAPS